ncbi:MAG: TerD family protein [Christensenellales bacterium]
MGKSNFLKAYCDKTNKYYGLEIQKRGSSWKVVNFISLSDEEAAVMTSEIKQDIFYTYDNLLACSKCGNRLVSGCSCASRWCRGKDYDLQCIYCKHLKLDYSAPTGAKGYKEGDTIRLSQGQEVKISYQDKRPLSKIIVGIGWDPSRTSENMDVDSSVFVLGNNDSEKIYFGNLEHPTGCVKHHGDNLTGEDKGSNDDDENITVYLNKVPTNRDKLVFAINIYKCKERRQNLGSVRNMYIRLYDPDSKKVMIEYKVDGNMKGYTALIIGMAYRSGAGWNFKALGRGSNAAGILELHEEAKRL